MRAPLIQKTEDAPASQGQWPKLRRTIESTSAFAVKNGVANSNGVTNSNGVANPNGVANSNGVENNVDIQEEEDEEEEEEVELRPSRVHPFMHLFCSNNLRIPTSVTHEWCPRSSRRNDYL